MSSNTTDSVPGRSNGDLCDQNIVESLRLELIRLVEEDLTPLSSKYGYSEVSLESNIKWRPMVLVLGNYSSGKSTLINEFLGGAIQETGQAPTDDSFTVITHDDSISGSESTDPVSLSELRDGKVLLSDPQYPFEVLRKQGARFASHFRLKKVNAPILQNLAIVDTPGMLDSISERDRGYDYQQVIGDLAQIADLILVLFDPHKAGTVQETYHSLRKTLPNKTFEDRVIFVLNRIDECGNLPDLLKVYGTLCWNLSQMTGRKDIPKILLTYSPSVIQDQSEETAAFLSLLNNQRQELQNAVLDAPRNRLDNLASFVETHSERLGHLVEGVHAFTKKNRDFRLKASIIGLFIGLFIGAGISFYISSTQPWGPMTQGVSIALGSGLALCAYIVWLLLAGRVLHLFIRPALLHDLDSLTELRTQARKDSWQVIREPLREFLKSGKPLGSVASTRRELAGLRAVYDKGTKEVRQAINES